MSLEIVPCARCGDPVTWAITEAGKRMPLDAGANPRGNVVLRMTRDGLRAHVLRAGERVPEEERRLAHFATCGTRRRRWPALTVLRSIDPE